MAKVLFVNGSPHKDGCTNAALEIEGIQIIRTLGNNIAWLLKNPQKSNFWGHLMGQKSLFLIRYL